MIAAAERALRSAVWKRLRDDPALSLKVAGRIYDGIPRGAILPLLAFGDAQLRDFSTSSSRGTEHDLRIDVVSEQPGSAEALEIADLVTRSLDQSPLTLDGFALVNLTFRSAESRRETNQRYLRMSLRWRIITELI